MTFANILYRWLWTYVTKTGLVLCGGDSGPSQTSSTNTTTNIPEYARPYFERLMDRSEAVSNSSYVPYDGARVQGFTPLQQQAFNNVGNMQAPSQIRDATGLAGLSAQGALGTTGYQAGRIGSTYNPQGINMFNAPDRVQSQFQPGQFDAAAAQRYMSPYQQNVTDIAKREANRQFGQQQVASDAGAAQRGSFGGSRHALVAEEAQRNQNQLLSDIQMKGDQDAYANAQAQYERDRQAQAMAGQMGLGAQQFNSQQQLAYGNAGLGAQQFNEQARQQAAQLAMQGQIANEQAQLGAAGLQQKGYALAGDMAGQLGQLGQMDQTLALSRYNAMNQMGTQQQQLGQTALDTAYQDFINQRDYDKQNLAWLGGQLRGVPVSANSDVSTTQPGPSPLGQLAGLGIAGAGLYNTMNSTAG